MRALIPNLTTANIRAEAARVGLSLHSLAQQAGIPASTMYRRLDNGRWTVDEIAEIARVLDLPTATLVAS